MKMNAFEYLLMTFNVGRHVYLKGIVRDLQELSQLQAGRKILEIGCGNGTGTLLIEEYFKPLKLIATEFDKRLVEVAQKKNFNSKTNVQQGDATNLPFDDEEFDAVIGLSVIHHIPDWQKCVDELHRLLQPNGLLIIKELSIETFQSPFGRIARKFVDHPYENMLKKDDFLKYLESSGFETIALRPHVMLGLLQDFLLVARKKR